MNAQNYRRGLGHIETSDSDAKVAVLNAQTTDEGWNPLTSVILDLSTLFSIHKSTGEVWDPWRLVILNQKALFCMQKTQVRAGTHRD